MPINVLIPEACLKVANINSYIVNPLSTSDSLSSLLQRTPYLSPSNKPVEAGFRGFWKDYPNIYALCDQLSLQQNEVFTPYTNSSFYSPDGLEATAPVFAESKYPTLPSPLGQVLATIPYFERLPIQDRASMVGLLLATIDW